MSPVRPAKAIVCPYAASRYGVQVPARRPPPFDRAHALWQDRPGSKGRYRRRAKPGEEPAGTENRFGIAMRGRT